MDDYVEKFKRETARIERRIKILRVVTPSIWLVAAGFGWWSRSRWMYFDIAGFLGTVSMMFYIEWRSRRRRAHYKRVVAGMRAELVLEPEWAPCRVCGKMLRLPPWPIVTESIQCVEHGA